MANDNLHCTNYNLNYLTDNEDDVVISGLAGNFPESTDVYHFRDNLFNKVDLVTEDERRWKANVHLEIPKRSGKVYDIDKFDAGYFGVTNQQNNYMDPVIRLSLERSVEAINDAGYSVEDLAGTDTAVIVGICFIETAKYIFQTKHDRFCDAINGTSKNMVAKQISHALKLKGVSISLDTACSSSLYAFNHGYEMIKSGKFRKALICSGSVCLQPQVTLQFIRLGVLSYDGSCKCFDEAANGYVRSEGIVVCLLERLKGAKRIYAKIIHSKTNCDGYKKEGITFPSTELQTILLEEFYDECKVDPRTLTYVEAHGTGTKVGDPEELETLDKVFCTGRNTPLYIGSVKSNIGHNEPSSGLCGVVKTLISMETGYIPPNIHYKTPRKGIKALEEGRMIVVDEKMPLPDNRGMFAVNNFGFGGANAHVLLNWNWKVKINNGLPEDNIPRLICINSRARKGIDVLLDDFKARNLDAEYIYLTHQAFRKSPSINMYRGYGIYTKQGEIKRSSVKYNGVKRNLNFVFTNFGKEWLKISQELLDIPAFAKIIKSIHDILSEIVNADLEGIVNKKIKDQTVSDSLGTIILQIALANLFKEINLLPDQILGFDSGKIAVSYTKEHLTLKEAVLSAFPKDPLSKIKKNKPKISNGVSQINGNCYQNGSYENGDEFDPSPKYLNGTSIDVFTDDAVYVVIGDDSKDVPQNSLSLINVESKDYINEFLTSLGRLYEYGYDMELDKLYPRIQLPVSRGTPMLSPHLRWNHEKTHKVHYYEPEKKSLHRLIKIDPKTDEWGFIVGHVIDGRNLFPATGYLVLVWETLALMTGKEISKMKVIFEDVKYIRASHVQPDGSLVLAVTIQPGLNYFEICEDDSIVVTGKMYDTNYEEVNQIPQISCDEHDMSLNEKDLYKELNIRGYHYSGKFKNIKNCSVDGFRARIQWDDNWISFMDCLLQLSMASRDTRNLYIPTAVKYLSIDAPKHIAAAKRHNNIIPVEALGDINIVRTGGVEIKGLDVSTIPRRKGGDPILETYKFIPNETSLDTHDSLRILVQLILENSDTIQVKVVEAISKDAKEDNLLCHTIQRALEDLPLIRQEIVVLSEKPVEFTNVAVQNTQLATESNCLILILSSVLETVELKAALNAINEAKGFIISREHLQVNLSKFEGGPLQVLCSHQTENDMLVLLKPFPKSETKYVSLDVSDISDEFQWITKLQELLKEPNKVILYSQRNDLNGILGLINCLRNEVHDNRLIAFSIIDEAPPFDIELDFYKRQLAKNLGINIWKDGAWGTYRHLLLPQSQTVEKEHCFVNVGTRGDLSTLSWFEGNIDRNEHISNETEIIDVYYAALNFKDLMIASGRLSADTVTLNRITQECILGFEISGRNSRGKRVMAMCNSGVLASLGIIHKRYIHEVPDSWTMEDAATVPVVYNTVIDSLFLDQMPTPGQSILIHSGTGGIGLAAINLSLHFGLDIFVTVGTDEKRNYIKTHYPQIKEEHIGNSRDTSFELMVRRCTNGRGVDYVLNSLAEEKLIASIRCLAKGGKFVEIGRFDLQNNTPLALQLLDRQVQFKGVGLDKKLELGDSHKLDEFNKVFKDLLKCGAIKPLPSTIFKEDETQQALRYLGTGKHIGKVLIKIRDEENKKVYSPPARLFKGLARFFCNSQSSYVVLGGLGGFGLELADWLVLRGAKKLVLTSKSGLSNGYQKYRQRIWKNYGVEISNTTIDASTEKGCTELLNIANELGPVDGIFNLAVILKDALFENQTVENFKLSLGPKARTTRYLDSISRKLCPDLRYFVIFSSISCGRGNAGQTNYGLSNSVMERICERRKRDGYPALAIQWGAVGDVGLVAKMQEDHKELVIGGTLQQRISSCLYVLDNLLRQNDPIVASMVVAEKKYGSSGGNMFETVLNILGVTNIKAVSVHSTFPELGMDSMMAVEIKQTLEREYEIFLAPQEVREMTLARLKDLSSGEVETPVDVTTPQKELPVDIQLLLHYIGTEENANVPVVKMKTSVEENEKAPQVFILPGIEGMAAVVEPLCKKLKAHVSCLQFCSNSHAKTVEEMALSAFSHLARTDCDITLLAYSYSGLVVIELLKLLKSTARGCKVIFIDGAPEFVKQALEGYFKGEDEQAVQIILLCNIMMRYMSYDYIMKHQQNILTHKSLEDKIDYMISVSPKVDVSKKYIVEMCSSTYNRILAAFKYQPPTDKLKSTAFLFKPNFSTISTLSNDYGLSNLFEDHVEVVSLDGNHVTILENDELSERINNILK